MTKKERVKAVFEKKIPDRIPVMLHNFQSSAHEAGLTMKEFREDDGIPVGFKALLFNRYMKTAYSVADEIPAFMDFYEKYYG